MDTNTQSVIVSVYLYGAIGLLLVLLFEGFKWQKAVFCPRVLSNKLKTPKRSLDGFLRWIIVTLSVSDKETLDIVGTDGYVFLRFLRLLAKVTSFAGFWGLAVLLPIYHSDPMITIGVESLTMANVDINSPKLWASLVFAWVFALYLLYSLHYEYKEFVDIRQRYFSYPGAEVPIQSVYSCLVENLPRHLQNDVALKEFFETLFPGEVYAAVVVQNLKKCEQTIKDRNALLHKLESTIAKYESMDVKSELPSMLSDGVKVSAIACYKDQIIEKDSLLKSQQEEAQLYLQLSEPAPEFSDRTTQNILHGNDLEKQDIEDASSFNTNELEQGSGKNDALLKASKATKTEALSKSLAAVIASANAKSELPLTASNGFITFSTAKATASCSQMPLLSSTYRDLKVRRANAPTDYIWTNITSSQHWSAIADWIVFLILCTGILYWGAVIAFIGAITNPERIADVIPAVNNLSPDQIAFLSTTLPIFVLTIILLLLPLLLDTLARYVQGKKTHAEVQSMLCKWGYLYNIINIYLLLVAGSTIQIIEAAINDPASIPYILGLAIPMQSVFFLNYFIFKVFLGNPFVMSRLLPWIYVNVYTQCTNEKLFTIRQILTDPFSNAFNNYGWDIPDALYVLTVTLLYWVMTPLITAISAIYFACYYVIYKYQLLYVMVPIYQTGGKYFYFMYKYTMISLLVSSIALLGYMGIKQAPTQTALLVPLPLVICLAWWYTSECFQVFSESTALSNIAERDYSKSYVPSGRMSGSGEGLHEKLWGTSKQSNEYIDNSHSVVTSTVEAVSQFSPSFYKQPALREGPAKVFPYRIDNEPLFDSRRQLSPTYFDALDFLGEDINTSTALKAFTNEAPL